MRGGSESKNTRQQRSVLSFLSLSSLHNLIWLVLQIPQFILAYSVFNSLLLMAVSVSVAGGLQQRAVFISLFSFHVTMQNFLRDSGWLLHSCQSGAENSRHAATVAFFLLYYFLWYSSPFLKIFSYCLTAHCSFMAGGCTVHKWESNQSYY